MSKIKNKRIHDGLRAERKKGLAQQILDDNSAVPVKRGKRQKEYKEDEPYVDEKLSKKILDEARKQQESLEEKTIAGRSSEKMPSVTRTDPWEHDASDSDESLPLDDEDYYDYLVEEIKEEDEEALKKFMRSSDLAQTLQERITEKHTEIETRLTDNESVASQLQPLDERVVAMYTSIKEILSKYRSGKLPKAFKVIPALRNWEQILYLTSPETWSAAAMYQATRLFASNLKAKMAQRFYNLVLLPRMRDDIGEYKRLNYHLYQALKKSLFKPAAFFKGVLLPLCEAGNCTLREATILSSVMAKNSIPMLHSAAAMLRIAEMEYSGANSLFLRTLIDKKYALPYRVVDALVFHFIQFERDQREMPVLWHQSLLAFSQRYKEDVSSEQKSALLALVRRQRHDSITPEIRRELVNSKCRDTELPVPDMDTT